MQTSFVACGPGDGGDTRHVEASAGVVVGEREQQHSGDRRPDEREVAMGGKRRHREHGDDQREHGGRQALHVTMLAP